MIYLVSYTLNPTRKNRNLEKELQSTGTWWHHLDFVWMLTSNEPIEQLYNRLGQHLQQNDHIFIAEITPYAKYQGWLPKDAWDWLENNRFK